MDTSVFPHSESHAEAKDEQWQTDFTLGLRRGLPIALGYIPVSFTFRVGGGRGGLGGSLS